MPQMMPIYWLIIFFFLLIGYGVFISIFSEYFMFSKKKIMLMDNIVCFKNFSFLKK